MQLNLCIVNNEFVPIEEILEKYGAMYIDSVSINRNETNLDKERKFVEVEILDEFGKSALDDCPKYFPLSLLKELREGQTVNVRIKDRFTQTTIFEEFVQINQLFAEEIEPLFGNKPFHEIIASM